MTTVADMVADAKGRIENLSVDEVEQERRSGGEVTEVQQRKPQ